MLDAPSAMRGTRIEINDCHAGAPAQQVTVTRTGRLKMRDMCLDIPDRIAANHVAVILAPCAIISSEIWQFR